MSRMQEELLELDIRHGVRERESRREGNVLFQMMRQDLSQVGAVLRQELPPAPPLLLPFDLL